MLDELRLPAPMPCPPISATDHKKLRSIIETAKSAVMGSSMKTTDIEKERPFLTRGDIVWLLDRGLAMLKDEPIMIETEAPITVFGDIHGQLNDLIALLDATGWPPSTRCLFLGDYIDRGPYSIETICFLLALKILHHNDVFLLRGNHEVKEINRRYGFYDDVIKTYDRDLYALFNDVFGYLPIAGLIGQRVFCVHGGISPKIASLDLLRSVTKPLPSIPPESFVVDLLWSDPDPTIEGFAPSMRGISVVFGKDALANFCSQLDVDIVLRGHQVVSGGFEFFGDRHLATIFSARDYAGQFTNAAGAVSVDKNLKLQFTRLPSRTEKSQRLPPEKAPSAFSLKPRTQANTTVYLP